MNKYKIVFKDGDCEKCIFGYPDFDNENTLLKVNTDQGNVVYINRSQIIFMKELREGMHRD